MKAKEILVLALVVLGMGAIVLGMVAAISGGKSTTEGGAALKVPVSAGDWKQGPDNAKAVLVEYSDLQCPACRYFYGIVKQVHGAYGDKVQVVYRHFPLSQHQYARQAAIAAEAAGRQGKFWEMHDLLFEKQDEWAQSRNIGQSLLGYANALGLNAETFNKDTQDPALAQKIEASVKEGTDQQLQGTPTFFLNGKLIASPRSFDEFKKLIDAELGK